MRFQKATQAITLATFVVLLLAAAYPYREGLGVDFFLRLDPLIGLATSLAARTFLPSLLPGLIVLATALLFGVASVLVVVEDPWRPCSGLKRT